MKQMRWLTSLMAVALLTATMVIGGEGEDTTKPDDILDLAVTTDDVAPVSAQYLVSYFHGDRRCATCIKLENYSQSAISEAYAEELADSSVLWRTVNYDDDENQHYIDDYALFTKAVIVSRLVNGREKDWVNLDKIWDLVGDSAEFVEYVRTETGKFMAGATKDD